MSEVSKPQVKQHVQCDSLPVVSGEWVTNFRKQLYAGCQCAGAHQLNGTLWEQLAQDCSHVPPLLTSPQTVSVCGYLATDHSVFPVTWRKRKPWTWCFSFSPCDGTYWNYLYEEIEYILLTEVYAVTMRPLGQMNTWVSSVDQVGWWLQWYAQKRERAPFLPLVIFLCLVAAFLNN